MAMHLPDEVSPSASLQPQAISESGHSVVNARAVLHSKVEARKQTERDAQLLANRIKLLQQEEAKTLRNIELSRAKAARLVAIKHDASMMEARLLEAERRREEEKLAAKERNNYLREIEKASRASTKEQIYERKRLSAMESKRALRTSVQEKISEEEEDKQKSILRTEAIRRDRIHSRMRQEEARANRLKISTENYSDRVNHEDRMKHESEKLLTKLEHEELALIKRLQKAQEYHSKIASNESVSPVVTARKSTLPPRVSTPVSRKDLGGAAMR